ncbi:hypothetical protein K502DRAFT_337657 [Neoconidiobolus thromboides FSU 785]|nr:hypothetical protein K502DRAFT_337657 [Neoconidiobolus thromboides FSU 785]
MDNKIPESEKITTISADAFSMDDVNSKYTTNLEEEVKIAHSRIKKLEQELKQVKAEKDTYSESLKESVELRADLEVNYNKLQVEFDQYKATTVAALENRNKALQQDMENLAEKLIDETERRSELVHAKQLLEAELEELSQNLFEEANKMVADERRLNKAWEDKMEAQEKKYEELNILMEFEKEQCKELKAKIGELIEEREAASLALEESTNSTTPNHRSKRSLSISTTPAARSQHSSDSGYRGANTQGSDHDIFTSSNSALSFDSSDHRFHEFKEFLEAPVAKGLYLSSKFMKRCLNEDVDSALRFESSLLSGWMTHKRILSASQLGSINIYPFKGDASTLPPNVPYQCSFCTSSKGKSLIYQYNITGSEGEPRLLCLQCRDRLLAVCKFFAFLRMVRSGVIQGTPQKLYLDCLQAKHTMFLARVGAALATFDEQIGSLSEEEHESATIDSPIEEVATSGPSLPNFSVNVENTTL